MIKFEVIACYTQLGVYLLYIISFMYIHLVVCFIVLFRAALVRKQDFRACEGQGQHAVAYTFATAA